MIPNDINDEYLFKITDVDKSGRIPLPPITDTPSYGFLYRRECGFCGGEFFTSQERPKVCPNCGHKIEYKTP